MKKITYLLAVLLLPFTLQAATLAQAEKDFQDSDFATAKTAYETLLPSATGNDLYQIQLRLAACQYHLGEFLQAAQTMYDFPLPQDPLWQARFLLYRIRLANQVSGVYRRILNKNEIDSAQASQDKSQWTREQWQAQIDKDYRQLWSLRTALLDAPITSENLILNLQDTDTRRIPTLFDFTVQNWLEYLQSNPKLQVSPITSAVPSFLGGAARLKEGTSQDTARLTAQLLADAAEAPNTNRQNAQLFWKTDAVLLPFHNTAFVIEDEAKALAAAAAELEQLIGKDAPKASFWKRLKKSLSSDTATDYARSYAAFQLASLQNEHNQFAKAVQTCQFAGGKLTASYYTEACTQLIENISRQNISVRTQNTPVNRQAPVLPFSGKNLHRVFARVYKTSFDELSQFYQNRNSRRTLNSWSNVMQLDEKTLPALLARPVLHQTSVDVPYTQIGEAQQAELSLPALEAGFYIVALSTQENFDFKTADIYGWVINATDLALFASAAISGDPADYVAPRTAADKTLTPDVFHVYTFNLKTGEPVASNLRLITDWNGTQQNAATDAQGVFDAARKITVSSRERDENDNYTLDVLATQGASTAFTANHLYFHFYNPAPVQLFAQTDRAIYRPGQKVQLAAQAFEKLPRGLKTLGNTPVKFEVSDPNGKKVFTASARLNALGTAKTELTVPENNLLGVYSIQLSLTTDKRTYHTYQNFRVEEYKRPDYELTLQAPAKALEYGKKATLTGSAQYYMGTPLANAQVSYTLKRKNYVPPFYWWWVRPFDNAEKILLQGQTTTDDNGQFSLSFTPARQEEDEEFASYVLQADVYDESGRAISATRTYKISAHPHLFKVDFTQGFYDANTSSALAGIDLTDAEGNSVTGNLTWKIAQLENRQPTLLSNEDFICYRCPEPTTPLEKWYKDFTAVKTVLSMRLSFDKPGARQITLPPLPEGVYRLTLTSEKAAPQHMVFIVAQKNSKLLLPDVALAQHATYYPGETMRVLLGAGNLHGTKRVEIYQGNNFLTHRALLEKGVEIFELSLTQNHRGGVALRWFGASDYQFHQAQTSVTVPFDNKKLTVTPQIPATAKPGQAVNWTLNVKNAAGAATNGQANITIYDKSLDYYAPVSPLLSFTQLYSEQTGPADITASKQAPSVFGHTQPRSPVKYAFNLRALPTLNLDMMHYAYGMRKGLSRAAAPQLMMAKSAAVNSVSFAAMDSMAETASATEETAALGGAMMQDAKMAEKDESEQTPDNVRTDFSETAYFNPALPIVGGKANIQFTLPQSLTTFNVLGFALTENADFGDFKASVITQKDLMVRLTLPRFYRENDKGVLQAAVTNQSAKKVTAQVTLSLSKQGQNVLKDFGITQAVKTVVLPPNSTQFATWNITAPAKPDVYSITAVVRAGKESDGEQKTFPVLPGKMRLVASAHAALKNGTNNLHLTELDSVPAKDVELAALTLNPSLALSVINSMPHLLTNPYKDLVSSLNRYVPLAVVHQFYTTYPQLKEAVKKLPKRAGRTASWNENDPLRLTLLEQTPWLRQAQGRAQKEADLVNLFDDEIVQAQLKKELQTITRLQNASGAFTWFAGGPDDDYLTLYALSLFGEALAYKASIPQAAAQKAVRYIVPKIEKRLSQDKDGSVAAVSYALYAAYTLSAFPATWKEIANAKPNIKRWVDYADSQKKFMTPLGQIYAAAIYHRLGDDVKANAYLDRILARLKEDPLTGAYFAPEAQSWIWYNDTLSTQTVTLRTLVEMRPSSEKIGPMLQWLLFNRQVNDWTDSRAASQAVFTILQVMQAQGALSQPSSYQINWANETKNLSFAPLDWTENLQFVRTGTQLTPAAYTAQITKASPQTDFASLSAVYQAHDVRATEPGVINVHRAYFLRVKNEDKISLRPLADAQAVRVGDEVEVHLTLNTQSAFEYVLLDDPKPAGFESVDLLSGWNYQNVSFYREIKDANTHFFLNWVPRGTLTLRYILRPTVAGQLHALPAQVQSMYAPQYAAHSASDSFTIAQ